MEKFWVVLCLALLWVELQNGECRQIKRRKDAGENRIRPGGKRVKLRYPKLKEKDGGGRSQSLLTQVLDKGRFLRLADSTTMTPGKTMELRCKGSSIGWAYPPYLDTFNDSRLSIKQSDKYSQLVLTAPSAADTGTYSCWVTLCDGNECEKDPERTSVSYIYFTDQDNLFVPSAIHFEIVYLRPDKPAIIPCRATDPAASVTLHREVPPEEVPANGTLVSYDPTKGFVLQNPSPEHQGVFYCKAVTKATPQISNKYQLLYVEVPSGAPFVSLEGSVDSAGGGDTLSLICSVLGEPDVDVTFTWSFPGQDSRPADIQQSWRLITRGIGHTTRLSQSIMTLEDLEITDFGRYTCKAKNPHGETSVAYSIKSK